MSKGMQRLIYNCVCTCAILTGLLHPTAICLATEEVEENPLRHTEGPARIVESHTPVIRRDDGTQAPTEPAANQASDNPSDADQSNMVATVDDEGTTFRKSIQQQIEATRQSESLDDDTKTKILAALEKALESVRVAGETKTQLVELADQIEAIPTQLQSIKDQLKVPLPESVTPELDSVSLEQAESTHANVVAMLAAAREALKQNQAVAAELAESRKQSQKRSTELSAKRAELEAQLQAPPPEGVAEAILDAKKTEMTARLQRLTEEEKLLKSQLELAQASVELQPLRHDLDRREVAKLESEEAIWVAVLSDKRDQEALRQIEEAKRKARETDPALSQLAKENQTLAEVRSQYAADLKQVTQELQDIRESHATEEEAFQKIQNRVENIGMTEAIGHLLRTHQRKLLNDRPLRARAKQIESDLPQIELLTAQTDEQRQSMWDLDHLTQQHALPLLPRYEKQVAYDMVYEILATRKQYLTDLHSDLQTYQIKLTDLHIQLRQTAELTAEHRSYIGEHILWIRSANTVSWEDLEASRLALQTLLAPSRWLQVVQDVGTYLQRHLFVWLILVALFMIGMVINDRLKDRLTAVGKTKAVSSGIRFLPTAEVVAETAFAACFMPGSMLMLSLYLTRFPEASPLEVAMGVALRWTGLMWLGLSLLQQVCRSEGLAEAHFGWHPRNVKVIRKNLRFLVALGLPAVFIVTVIESFQDGDYVTSLGRLSFMCGMSVMALFTHRLLDPYRSGNGVWANPNVWLYRIRYAVHACCVLIPISLTALAATGYVYSAHQLAFRAQLSLWLVLGVVLAQAILGRYLQIARRNAAMRHMQHRRTEQAEQPEPDIPTESDIDFRSIGSQVRRLLRGATFVTLLVGLSFVWADMVPALKFLDRVELWMIETVDSTGEGELRWITLGDALLAISALFATVMAARNLPGLLNITIFERLPIDYGTRYALTAVSRYLISLLGAAIAFQFIGVTWRSVQWLVAAMTVGLGFGLQEIFANFVSGLIIFTERPVRVGDMVTVGNVTGKVTRVQIRATTITDFDRRELVVPNKRFITEDVINWTLSDPITRVVLPVGIAYDCDPEEARMQLLQVARVHPLVLDEPEPTAVFIGFGESTLDLELRVFIIGRDHVFQVQNELNIAINRAFRQANLEIAYPQRDLRIRSVDAAALPDALRRSQKAA